MEYKLEELLHNLHTFLFADAEQIIAELKHNILDRTHQEAEIGKQTLQQQLCLAFISSKIFNSDESLLQFLRQNSQLNERLISTVKKRIYELIIEYIKNRKQEVSSYLEQIRQTCLTSFLSDPSSLVKEVSLLVLFEIIQTYKEIDAVIRPKDLIVTLLDEIKLRRPAATVKGAIWQLVGLLHLHYPTHVGHHIAQSQTIQLQMLEEQIRTKKPEIKAITGMLKGFQHSLTIQCTLNDQQRNQMFLILTTLSQPIQDVTNKGVMKSAIKVLSQHANLFNSQIMKQSISLIERALQLCTFENLEIRDVANELLGSLIQQVSLSLDSSLDDHIRLFQHIMNQFDAIINSNEYKNIQLLSAIRAVGIFSKAILTILGPERLWEYLNSLSELSERRLIKDFSEQDRPESDLHNFKYILNKQKQLIAFIESYSFIIRNVQKEPSEAFLLHFMRVGLIGVNNHRKLYHKYRYRFYEALAQLLMSLTSFKNQFSIWLKKFVRNSLTETLKIPDSVIYGGESPSESLTDAVMFWHEFLNKDHIWSTEACESVYNEIINTCIGDIEDLDLTYKVNREKTHDEIYLQDSNAEYIANNSNDQSYLDRLTNFLEEWLPNCKDEWIIKWIPRFSQVLVKKASQCPRIPKLYTLLKIVVALTEKHKYFERFDQEIDISERDNTFNMLLAFLKELIGKSEEFQDKLLDSALVLLLHVPLSILYQPQNESIEQLQLWTPVMLRCLNLSALNNRIALQTITTLESWLNSLPLHFVSQLYQDILPRLSDFLVLESNTQEKDTYFFQNLIEDNKEKKIDRKEIANKVLDLLGKIGGHSHSIINNEIRKKHEKENFIRWDTQKRLKFCLPLGQKKIDIYLDSCLPRIIDLAQNSTEKRTRVAACELLHGLILFMIGSSATRPNGKQVDQEKMAAFAKLYAKLFPVIIRLATEIEEISRQLFEPLVFQIVRWFSSSKIHEHPEVESLLDALIEGTQSRNNSTLREMCSNAVAVFADWSLKHKSEDEIRENSLNIQSLLRRVESNSNHPDCFKRLSSVLCLSKILLIIQKHNLLIDRYLLEIARCVLSSLKNCHNSVEFSQDVIDNCSELLSYIQKLILKNHVMLLKDNQDRQIHTNLHEFLDFLLLKLTAVETVFRREAAKLWEGLVLNLTKYFQPQQLILSKYVPLQGQKAIWNISQIMFGMQKEQLSQLGIDSKKAEHQEIQRQMDTLTAQLDFLFWLIKIPKFRYLELNSKLKIDLKTIKLNIENFLFKQIKPDYDAICELEDDQKLAKLLQFEEDREQITKSLMRLLSSFFQLLLELSDSEIADLIPLNSQQSDTDNYVFELAIQILLVPAIHRLQLLVQDYHQEKLLRTPIEQFIKRTFMIQKRSQNTQKTICDIVYELCTVKIPQINLNRVTEFNAKDFHPRLLTNLLVGYLKLGTIDIEMKETLQEVAGQIESVVYPWMVLETPSCQESARLLVSFISQLHISNSTLCRWLTTESLVYHKASNLLLKYIADNWMHEARVGEYLIEKAITQIELLVVFLPILEFVSDHTPGYQKCLVQKIPECWYNNFEQDEHAERQIQIYSIILQKCKWSFEQQNTKLDETFINFVAQQAKNFLQKQDRYNVFFMQRVIRLVGLLFSLNLQKPIVCKLLPVLQSSFSKKMPIHSREIAKSNKNELLNYEKQLESYFDLLDISQNQEVFMLLRRVMCEHKSFLLSGRIQNSINNYVQNTLCNADSFAQFFNKTEEFWKIFFHEENDFIDDNYRWAIANKVLNRLLETCSLSFLEDLMVRLFQSEFLQSLEKRREDMPNIYQKYLLVREQTHVMLMLEIIVRRLDSDVIKINVTQRIYGKDAPPNQLTKTLIKYGEEAAKGHKMQGFAQEVQEIDSKVELTKINSVAQVQRRYCCAGYTLLSSVIMKTQTKQIVFSDYLFGQWLCLIDTTDGLYNFSVQTNFNSISLQSIEQKAFKQTDIQQVKTNNLLNEYVTSSFMATNQNFNSAMVFETQLDDVIDQPLLKEKEESSQGTAKISTLEIDQVNKHECMKNIKRALDRMHELFSSTWVPEQLPKFMQILIEDIRGGHLNLKIFILKLLVNNQDLFRPFAAHWFVPICEFVASKNTGGKGFHYFLRDLTTILVLWSDTAKPQQEHAELCSRVINTLIKLAADKNKIIFNINIELLAMLLHKWQHLVVVDKDVLANMLAIDDAVESSHLWKMTCIQVLALCCSFDVPIKSLKDSQGGDVDCEPRRFVLDSGEPGSDRLLISLLKLQDLKKKQLIFASSEVLGKILAKQPQHARVCLEKIMENDKKERHDIIVNVIERVTREFPQFLEQRKVFMKLVSYINVMTGSMRGAIFKSLARYYEICPRQQQIEIQKSVHAISDQILADISEDNQVSFLQLLTKIVRHDAEAGTLLLRQVIGNLKGIFVNNKSVATRELYFDLMVYLYERFDEFKVFAKSSLIHGLADPSETIRDRIFAYWNTETRLDPDPFLRSEQLLTVLYDQSEERAWLNNATNLLMHVSTTSADYNRKIFDQPLTECQFDPLTINPLKVNMNRSQPVTPSLARIAVLSASQYFEAKNIQRQPQKVQSPLAQIAEANEDVEMEDAYLSQNEVSNDHFKVAGQISQFSGNDQIMHQSSQFSQQDPRKLRATQKEGIPLFQPSQVISSSLVISALQYRKNQDPHSATSFISNQQQSQNSQDYSFSQAFYDPQLLSTKRSNFKIFQLPAQSQDEQFDQPGNQIQEQQFKIDYSQRKNQNQFSVGKFMEKHGIDYKPVNSSSDGSMIRVVKDGSMPSQLARKEEQNQIHKRTLMRKLQSLNKDKINMLRTYRVGEIPDIQIDHKDIILPLMVLVQKDSTIATELLVELFTELYKLTKNAEQRQRMGEGVRQILSRSRQFDYSIINCMHRVAIELLRIDGFLIDARVIEQTGRESMSYQTSLQLLEESIIQIGRNKPLAEEVSKSQANEPTTLVNKLAQVSIETKDYWFSLIQLNEIVGNEDALKGIWSSISQAPQVMLKTGLKMTKECEEIAEKISLTQEFRSKGQINSGLRVLEKILACDEFEKYFEEQVQLEIKNKQYESYADLLKWDKIALVAKEQHNSRQLLEIPQLQAEMLIRAQLRVPTQRQNLQMQIDVWSQNKESKAYLDRQFNYEQALNYVFSKDYDRARFYIDLEARDLLTQWKYLTKLSSFAQHILVQKIQKIYEMKEFLTTIKQLLIKESDELSPIALQQVANWVKRQPSFQYDRLSTWDDILTSRLSFIEQYKLNFKQGSTFFKQMENKMPSKFADVHNIQAKLFAQISKGAFKMGQYNSCDCYLQNCVSLREQGGSKDDLRIVVPIIKLKVQQFKQETLNFSFSEKFQKLTGVLKVLDTYVRKQEQHADIYSRIKAAYCQQNMHKKFVTILYKDICAQKDHKQVRVLLENYKAHTEKAFQASEKIHQLLQGQTYSKQEVMKSKTMYQFSKLCMKLLRQMDAEQHKKQLQQGLQQMGYTATQLGKLAVKNAFAAINLNNPQARNLVPRILEILALLDSTEVYNEFSESSKNTPAWIFLKWIQQLVAYINRPQSEVIAPKVRQIIRKYPHALFYSFQVLKSNLIISLTQQKKSALYLKLEEIFQQRFSVLQEWANALNSLVHPEHRVLSWITMIEDAIRQGSQDIQHLIRLLIEDTCQPKQSYGNYNQKFATKWARYFDTLYKKSPQDLLEALRTVREKISQYSLGEGEEKLQTFSSYLQELDNNDFYNQESFIEVPGQYENIDQEPIPGNHVKVACLRKTILILGSIRRPKRITVHGSNEKDYNLLIKGGEDLRLDQRVQQVFSIMNQVFKLDPSCQYRDLNLKTFNIVPITNRLGSLEWVQNTEPLKEMINREHKATNKGKDLLDSLAVNKRRQFLRKLPQNQGVEDIRQQHLALLELDSEKCVSNFNQQKQLIQWSLLRSGLENLCLTSSAFIAIKNTFIKSIAVLSIASYLLGIGDRHLENFLISTQDGEVLGIDYGCAFGFGIQLAVPELIPFRLTQQIEGVIAPHPMSGVYQQTMVHVLEALRKNKSLILDTCDIFIKEPLLDWLQSARRKQQRYFNSKTTQLELEEQLSFYPKQKIKVLRDKLDGYNPVYIVHNELKESSHYKLTYYKKLLDALQGPEGGLREQLLKEGKKYLEVTQQVDCLIELARCPDILGRAWIGWQAFI